MKGQELFELDGRVAVVIGGTTGLGREISLGFAAAGADVVASSRETEHVDEVATAIEALGRRTLREECDVLDRASIQRLHNAVIAAFGKVDILVNAAGMAKKVPTLDEDEDEWLKIIDLFADSDIFYRYFHFIRQRNNDTAFCSTVKFRQNKVK